MTFDQYKQQIDLWTREVHELGIRLENDKQVPFTFWKTFLGLTRKHHQDMYHGRFKNKTGLVPKYIIKAINYANLVEKDKFMQEVKKAIPEFEADKTS